MKRPRLEPGSPVSRLLFWLRDDLPEARIPGRWRWWITAACLISAVCFYVGRAFGSEVLP